MIGMFVGARGDPTRLVEDDDMMSRGRGRAHLATEFVEKPLELLCIRELIPSYAQDACFLPEPKWNAT